MNIDLSNRQHHILTRLTQQDYCSIDQLSSDFSITKQTVTRDINALCDLGLARRQNGGVSVPASLENSNYLTRKASFSDVKHKIATQVAQQIPNGSTVFLGIGTTISAIAEQLGQHQQLRIVTNNFEAAAILSHYDHIETWIAGGRLRHNDRDIIGESSDDLFQQFIADIGIISCAAVTPLQSVETSKKTIEWCLDHELQEAKVSQAIINNSLQTWLVAHENKWHQQACSKVAPLTNFDQVFKG
ncbi:DeoR/GlpR family DNA-binding transcription regulator [Psychromonas sp. KJ10-2]|uniref:DeoR/GlpR family DNA-binding transcription regulator n=1 Tax=Psychromonas sp. KJ10-2 TaxID=3391822 RepID=UPI0039B54F67